MVAAMMWRSEIYMKHGHDGARHAPIPPGASSRSLRPEDGLADCLRMVGVNATWPRSSAIMAGMGLPSQRLSGLSSPAPGHVQPAAQRDPGLQQSRLYPMSAASIWFGVGAVPW